MDIAISSRRHRLWLLPVVLLVVGALALHGGIGARSASAGEVPAFEGSYKRLPHELKQRMRGVSWHRGCPVPLADLRLLRMTFWRFDGEIGTGRMVVHRRQARRVLRAFEDSYDAKFRIRRMRLIEAYDGSDDRSMAANNTSGFNCRKVAGTDRWSEHAYGRAVDINPVQNPYVNGSTVEPAAGEKYLDRSDVRKGMIVRPGPVVRAFGRIDWGWGGDWSSVKDYQHFSRTGR